LCDENHAQIVATTHSYEFLKAIAPSLEPEEMSHNFQLVRLEKTDGQPKIKKFPAALYRDAIASDFEVR
jgi:hypothetical protein